jgi:DNA-binding response OmpR family regulator
MQNGRSIIAVVDDDPRVLESLENLLESCGYTVLTFANADAFLEADQATVDCLITDIGMPGMDGFQLLEHVKRVRPAMPVFLLTGRHEIADQRRVAAIEMDGLFRKPFDARHLLSEVSRALRRNQGEGENAN